MQVKLFKETTLEKAVEEMNRYFSHINVTVSQVTQLSIQEVDTKTVNIARPGEAMATVYICFLVFYNEIVEPF